VKIAGPRQRSSRIRSDDSFHLLDDLGLFVFSLLFLAFGSLKISSLIQHASGHFYTLS